MSVLTENIGVRRTNYDRNFIDAERIVRLNRRISIEIPSLVHYLRIVEYRRSVYPCYDVRLILCGKSVEILGVLKIVYRNASAGSAVYHIFNRPDLTAFHESVVLVRISGCSLHLTHHINFCERLIVFYRRTCEQDYEYDSHDKENDYDRNTYADSNLRAF